MRFRSNNVPGPAGFQMAPMVDVVFLLLIFFIVSWHYSDLEKETELEIIVPMAEQGQENRREIGQLIINVDAEGAIIINRQTKSVDELLVMLTELAKLYPNQAVVLRGHHEVPYEDIVKVLDVCHKANIWNVVFATNKPSE